MAYFKNNKTLFIHIPKNAGKSIEVSLRLCSEQHLSQLGSRSFLNRMVTLFLRKTANNDACSLLYGTIDVTLCAQHLTLQEIQLLNLIPQRLLSETRIFAVCRNPWSRAVSTFHHFANPSAHNRYDFESFCDEWYDSPISCHNIMAHRRKQIDFIRDCDGAIGVNKILKFENLQQEFPNLCKSWELDCQALPHIGKSSGSDAYQKMYSKKSRQKIERLFAEDIEFFNYEF